MRLNPMTLGQCLALLWLSASAAADVFEHPVAGDGAATETLQQLSNELAAQKNIAGDFIQEKFLSVLDKPLRSRGSFAFSADQGFTWQVKEPFSVTYSFSDGRLHKQDHGESKLIKPSEDPMLYGFFAFFSTVFDMSQAELEKNFAVYFQQQEHQWMLGLVPQESLVREAIASIIVEGQALYGLPQDNQRMTVVIERVTIRESSGDYSHLLFSY